MSTIGNTTNKVLESCDGGEAETQHQTPALACSSDVQTPALACSSDVQSVVPKPPIVSAPETNLPAPATLPPAPPATQVIAAPAAAVQEKPAECPPTSALSVVPSVAPELSCVYNPETQPNDPSLTAEHPDISLTSSDSKHIVDTHQLNSELTQESAMTSHAHTPHSHPHTPETAMTSQPHTPHSHWTNHPLMSNPPKKKRKQDELKLKSRSQMKKRRSTVKVTGPKQALLSAYFSSDSSHSGDLPSDGC